MTEYFNFIMTASRYLLKAWQNILFSLLAFAAIVFAVTITFHVLFSPLCVERIVRLTAMWLELGGSMLVAWGLWNAWMPFGEGNPFSRLQQWWQHFPRFRPPPIIGQGSSTIGPPMVQATGRVEAGPNASIEERLVVLEHARNFLDHQTTELFAQLSKLRHDFQKATDERNEAQTKATKLLRDVSTGDVRKETWGLLLFVFGILLGQFSQEIASWLGFGGVC